jgi:hypothetical protein
MKIWLMFVAMTILCWGMYVPTIHQGQVAFQKNGALRAFLFVGSAYFVTSVLVLGYMYFVQGDRLDFNTKAVSTSFVAGMLGAVGALGIVFAMKNGGSPLYVAPLVFAGAPIVNTIFSMIWHRPEKTPDIRFFLGIVVAAFGASMVLRYKPS